MERTVDCNLKDLKDESRKSGISRHAIGADLQDLTEVHEIVEEIRREGV